MNQILTTGIVLARTNYQEADRILTILTPDHGKVRVVAKGVRKSRSKMAAGTELLSVSEIGFMRGRGELFTLTTARLQLHFGNIVQHMERTMYAYDMLKRINRLTEDNAEADYFDLLIAVLEALNEQAIDLELIKLWTLVRLLVLAGHQPELSRDNQGNKLNPAPHYGFDMEAMAFYPSSDGLYEAGHIKLMRLCVQQPLDRLQRVEGVAAYGALSQNLMQTISQMYLQN